MAQVHWSVTPYDTPKPARAEPPSQQPSDLFYVTERLLGIPAAMLQRQSVKALDASDSPGRSPRLYSRASYPVGSSRRAICLKESLSKVNGV